MNIPLVDLVQKAHFKIVKHKCFVTTSNSLVHTAWCNFLNLITLGLDWKYFSKWLTPDFKWTFTQAFIQLSICVLLLVKLSQSYLEFHFPEKKPCIGRSYWAFLFGWFFSHCCWRGSTDLYWQKEEKLWSWTSSQREFPNLIFYMFPIRYFLYPYWQSLQHRTVIFVWICGQEGIYLEDLRKKDLIKISNAAPYAIWQWL